MSYSSQIQNLERQYKLIENSKEQKDLDKKTEILNELRRLRRLDYEDKQRVNLDDDR